MSIENQKGAIAVQNLLAIAPFWFSMLFNSVNALLALSWCYIFFQVVLFNLWAIY